MRNLETNYMGLSLKSPLVAASSGLTSSLTQLEQLEKAGIAAVVLKSLFEEQITNEVNHLLEENGNNTDYPEAEDYIRNYTRSNSLESYLSLIKQAKNTLSIPVIASVNCIHSNDWIDFALEIEKAGANAIELNIYEMPLDRNVSSEVYEKQYVDIVRNLRVKIKLPIAVKISPYFTNLPRITDQLIANGASAVVLLNRFYEPDFDLEKLQFISSEVFSTEADLNRSLRWTGIIKGVLPKVEIAASGGVHSANAVIKQLLAGAQVVQLCSVLYKQKFNVISEMETQLSSFMNKWGFDSLDEFRGKMSYSQISTPALYERAQFMKYFSNKK